MSHPTYEITVVDTDNEVLQSETRSRKDSAVSVAEQLFADNPSLTVRVVTDAGTEVFRKDASEQEPVEGEVDRLIAANASDEVIAEAVTRAKPNTRVAEATSFDIPEFDGLTPAYVRARTQTVVYRKNDLTGLIVLDTRTNDTYDAANTAEARAITNRLEAEETARRNAAKAVVKQAKAEAKAARAAKAEAKRVADAEAKATRKAAREAAKQAKAETPVEEPANA